jgi:SAM-dependent methyltransferase
MVVRFRYILLGATVLVKRGWVGLRVARELLMNPMDSFRYFEFDFMWKRTHRASLGAYLDVSSPRLFTLLLMAEQGDLYADIANPDESDLNKTHEYLSALGLESRACLQARTLESLVSMPQAYDTIISISVVEHILNDRQAVEIMWKLLKPGGRLLITVPCATEAFEEYIDYNEYGLLTPDKEGFVFGQRLYDQRLLEEKIWSVTGMPDLVEIYGEKVMGSFLANRAAKLSSRYYPFWREPYMMGVDYVRFAELAELPGWGVIAMEFVKRGTS